MNSVAVFLAFTTCLTLSARPADACMDGTSTVCEYTFVLRRWRTMTYTAPNGQAYRVGLNGTRLQIVENSFHYKVDEPIIGTFLDVDDVITADGQVRDIITINDQFPGPTLHVMAGDTVVVHVYNLMAFEAATIHWHGMKLQDNPWMDGVPHVTQCPIQPRQKFTYRFKAEPHGTHWYHSHLSVQHVDGLYGMLIIHPVVPTLPEFVVSLNEWYHEDAITYEMQYPWNPEKPGPGDMNNHITERDYRFDSVHASVIVFKSALFNGRGRFGDVPLPLETFTVTAGERYYFRLAHAGSDYGFEISIDGHMLDLVALDGDDIIPIRVHSFIIMVGETVDFEIVADQPADRYWMRAVTLRYGAGINPVYDGIIRETRAIVSYAGVQGDADPTTQKIPCTAQSPCDVFNCPYGHTPASFNVNCIHMGDAHSRQNPTDLAREYGLNDPDEDVVEVFLNFAFFTSFRVTPTAMSRIFVPSRVPMYSKDILEYSTPCDQEACDRDGCECTFVYDIPYNKTIQLVMSNMAPGHFLVANHAMHLHSHQFAVLKTAFVAQDPDTGIYAADMPPEIDCFNDNKLICTKPGWAGERPALNKVDPPLKNTVVVAARGYTVVRFRSTTPGFWLLHCHMTQHFSGGMIMVLNEAPGHHPPPPADFPKCDDFAWSEGEYEEYLQEAKRVRDGRRPPPPGPGVNQTRNAVPPHDHEDDVEDGSSLTVSLSMAVGLSFAFILVGAFLPLIAVGLYACCAARSKEKM